MGIKDKQKKEGTMSWSKMRKGRTIRENIEVYCFNNYNRVRKSCVICNFDDWESLINSNLVSSPNAVLDGCCHCRCFLKILKSFCFKDNEELDSEIPYFVTYISRLQTKYDVYKVTRHIEYNAFLGEMSLDV